jgi:sec-independent protein translocase protein TatA
MIGFGLGWQELMIMLVIVLLLFGSTKLPALMRSFGQGINEFKRGMNDPGDDLAQDDQPKEPVEHK